MACRVCAHVTRCPCAPPRYGDITIPHEFVDFIVVHRDVEQTLGAAHADALRFLTPDSTTSRNYGIARLRFMNRVLGATPRRTPADRALARLAASLLVPLIAPGCSVQIGTGMPEEVAAVLHNTGVLDKLTTIVESGTLGGLAAPGAYFGASVNPDRLVSSAEVFQRIYRHLDVILVGALQVWPRSLNFPAAGHCWSPLPPSAVCPLWVGAGGQPGQRERVQAR